MNLRLEVLKLVKSNKKQNNDHINIIKNMDIGINYQNYDPNINIVFSMTSHPKRINSVYISIISLLRQTMKPNHVCLYLANNDFPNGENDLPEELILLKSKGLEIIFCEDFKVHNKIIHALTQFPNSLIINFDDDTYYHSELCKNFYDEHIKNPNYIISARLRIVSLNNLNHFIVDEKYGDKKTSTNSLHYYPITSYGGTAYPPNCFNKEIFNTENMMKLTPYSVEVWLWAMAIMNNTYSKKLKINFSPSFQYHNASALWDYNKQLNKINLNNRSIQLNRVINEYDINSILKLNYKKLENDDLFLNKRNI